MDGSILIVIPCFNEELRLPVKEYEQFLARENNLQIMFVDDGSTDQTGKTLKLIQDQFPTLVSIHSLSTNSGKAEAIRQGMLKSLNEPFDYLGYFDADLATPLEEASYLLKSASNSNPKMIFGARVDLFGSTEIKRSMIRHYFGRIFATLVSNILGMKVYDTQCGAKLFKKDVVEQLFNRPFLSKWLFDIELLMRMKESIDKEELSDQIVELPLRKWTEKGDSKVGIISLLKVPIDLIAIYLSYSRK